MAHDMKLRLEELTENPSPRVPICLTLDVSGSMHGSKLQDLNAAVRSFYDSVRSDEMACMSAEIAIVTFGNRVRQISEFSSIERQSVPTLECSGSTPMGEAVRESLAALEQAKRVYSQMGVDYFQPWLVLMTDGTPTDDISAAVEQCRSLVEKRKLTVFPIAIGQDADLATLARFSPNLPPLRIESTDLKAFFSWLSASVTKVSVSNPGDSSSSSLGAMEFKKMALDWQTAFQQDRK